MLGISEVLFFLLLSVGVLYKFPSNLSYAYVQPAVRKVLQKWKRIELAGWGSFKGKRPSRAKITPATGMLYLIIFLNFTLFYQYPSVLCIAVLCVTDLDKACDSILWQNLIMHHVDHSGGLLIDLLQGLLKFEPSERLTAKEALKHPFFKESNRRL
jgi:serine/threonine protein kinase